MTPATPERQLDRGARLVLVFALAFVALDIAQLAYRFTLPTEGWVVKEEMDARDFPLSRNVAGEPSPLQPGDALHIIGGIPSEQLLASTRPSFPRPADWRVGRSIRVQLPCNQVVSHSGGRRSRRLGR